MVFGARDQAFVQARAVHRIHSHIRGILPETLGPFPAGSPYYANEAHAALWVHATLCHSAVLVYKRVLPALTAAQKDRYWEEARHFAALFGIRRPMLYPSELQARVPVAGSGLIELGTAARSAFP
jgi:uncharacterized protein (DUF2236 family)